MTDAGGEMIAKSTAFVVLTHVGIDRAGDSFAAIARWVRTTQSVACSRARSQTTACRIIDGVEDQVATHPLTGQEVFNAMAQKREGYDGRGATSAPQGAGRGATRVRSSPSSEIPIAPTWTPRTAAVPLSPAGDDNNANDHAERGGGGAMGRTASGQRRLALEQQAAALAAEQAELRHALRQHKLGPTDWSALQGEVAAVQAALDQVQAALVAATRHEQRRQAAPAAAAGVRHAGRSTERVVPASGSRRGARGWG